MLGRSVSEQPAAPSVEQAPPRNRLGPFLCWAVVFADIGTSVYYTPGILFGQVGVHAALFVAMTTVVFVLLALKYAEVCIRYPEGGGVVTVGARALHPFVGVIGGMFILVDYFLTAAISVDSGMVYLSDVIKSLAPLVVPISLIALVVLGILNWIGISESAKVSATFACAAFIGQVLVLITVFFRIGLGGVLHTIPQALSGPHLTPLSLLTGYAGAFLAFSGLESISQLSPVMATPRQRVARLAMGAVVVTIGITSPLLTLLSTTLLPRSSDPNQFISLLGGFSAGRLLEWEVAISGSLLLIFASNTAIIGTYHVLLALSRMRFFPPFITQRNRLRNTPQWAILLATGIPLAVLALAHGNLGLLGDLYAFGLLGAFSVTCLSLDIVRWRERRIRKAQKDQTNIRDIRWPHDHAVSRRGERFSNGKVPPVSPLIFALGVLTTVLVVLAWCTNLVAKPLATEFGGGVSGIGLLIAFTTYTVQRRRGRALVFPTRIHAALPHALLAILPREEEEIEAVVEATVAAADGRPIAFLYRGTPESQVRQPRLFEVVDPYLNDRAAHEAFARAEAAARRYNLDRRYIYVPPHLGPDAVRRVWQTLRPEETLVAPEDAGLFHDLGIERVRRTPSTVGTEPIVHYLKRW